MVNAKPSGDYLFILEHFLVNQLGLGMHKSSSYPVSTMYLMDTVTEFNDKATESKFHFSKVFCFLFVENIYSWVFGYFFY